EPLQHRIRVHLKHPRRAPDAQAFGQACHRTHNEIDRDTLTIEERAEGLQKVAATGDAQQLPPAAPIGMADSTEIAPACPAPVPAIRVRTEMDGGIDRAAAPSRRHKTWGRS